PRTRTGFGDVVLGVCPARQQRHAIAGAPAFDPVADRVHLAPALVPRCTGIERVVEPRTTRPHRHVRGADAAPVQAHPDLSGPGLRHRYPFDTYFPFAPEHRRLHHAHAALLPAVAASRRTR